VKFLVFPLMKARHGSGGFSGESGALLPTVHRATSGWGGQRVRLGQPILNTSWRRRARLRAALPL